MTIVAELLANDERRWKAIVARDATAVGAFFYSVRTTGVYCRPGCPAKQPLRKNVSFFDSCRAAELAGYRPCKRCRPRGDSIAERQSMIVAAACRRIEASGEPLQLDDLAKSLHVSSFHLHRLFKKEVGLTPRGYALAKQSKAARAMQSNKNRNPSHSLNALPPSVKKSLGSSTQVIRSRGRGETIVYAVTTCSLGKLLVAMSSVGICSIALGDDLKLLVEELASQFPFATMECGDTSLERQVAEVVKLVETPHTRVNLPLDIRGTAFQQRVWTALRSIPIGETLSYTELAAKLGNPKAVRAVASACAANKLAIAIPCHRVVRSDGALAGFRWGMDRKAALLDREQ